MDLTTSQLEFMNERVAEPDERWKGSPEDLIHEREKLYADFTLLRASVVKNLKEEKWKAFLDRRWHQYAELGFTFSPHAKPEWCAFWKNRLIKAPLSFHVGLVQYTRHSVKTTKQKLRQLAEKAEKTDEVVGGGLLDL